jgi:chemotaxis protein MotB
MMKRTLMLGMMGAWLVAQTGCVKQSTYDAAMADARRTLESSQASAADKLKQSEAQAKRRLEEEQAAHTATRQELDGCRGQLADARSKLDAATALTQKLSSDLDRCGKKMKDETGALAAALAETQAALEEARKAKQAAEARAQLFKKLTEKFQRMIDAGSLRIGLRAGRMVLALQNDILFDSGKVDVKPAGVVALKELAGILKTLGRQLQVSGHTDNVAIQTQRFPSNWELSTARAINVTHILVAEGVPPTSLSAAGYGEFDPIASNDTPDGKARNRRIEITLQPDISELIAVPEAK